MHLLPQKALPVVAECMRTGADKYGPQNWLDEKVTATAYCDAIDRHLRLYLMGQECALDSKMHHLAHIAATAMILLDAAMVGQAADDRRHYPDADASDIMEDLKKIREEARLG